MKFIKNIKLFMLLGLLLHVSMSFARYLNADEAQNILDAIEEFKESGDTVASNWTPTGPTQEDILASKKVKKLAASGSREESLIDAAQKGDYKKIAEIITAGVELEARNSQDRTALMKAAEQGHADIVKLLLDAGADVQAIDTFGCTALFIAADKNHAEVVKILIDRGAGVDENFTEIFVSAVCKGKTELVKALIGNGAHVTYDMINEIDMMVSYGKSEMRTIINDLKSAI